jgi:hypothetical protein
MSGVWYVSVVADDRDDDHLMAVDADQLGDELGEPSHAESPGGGPVGREWTFVRVWIYRSHSRYPHFGRVPAGGLALPVVQHKGDQPTDDCVDKVGEAAVIGRDALEEPVVEASTWIHFTPPAPDG